MTPTFTGKILDGKLFLSKPDHFKQYLHTLNGKPVEVTVGKITHKRSNSQNRYYWGIVVKEIAQHTGHDPEQIHELLKQMFSPKWHMVYSQGPYKLNDSANDVTIPTSTTRLDTLAFVEYTEKCRLWANEFLGLRLPLPGEVTALDA